jgi:hypothetical protein
MHSKITRRKAWKKLRNSRKHEHVLLVFHSEDALIPLLVRLIHVTHVDS